MREETFGPIMPVMRSDVDEAVALANDTEFGLSAAVIGGSEAEAYRSRERIDAGKSRPGHLPDLPCGEAESDSFGASGSPAAPAWRAISVSRLC